ncbi:MAG: DUF6157 family protein [Leptospirales bacterium]
MNRMNSAMNYFDTFILVAPDCPVRASVIPETKRKRSAVAVLEYDLLSVNPYCYTQEELLFEVYIRRQGVSAGVLESKRLELWSDFFAKSRPCLRTSSLPKKYGWGIHFDGNGKIALVPMESEEYRRLSNDISVKQLVALRSGRG